MIYYKNTENAKAFFLFSIIEGVISLPIAFTLIRFFEMGVLGLTLGQFSASFLILCYLIFSIRNESKIIFDIPSFLKSFKSSLPLTFKIFFGVISTNLDKILLGKIGEMKGLGVYNLGQKIGYVAFTYTLAIYNIFSPKVYKDMFDMGLDGGKQIGLYLTKFFYISIAGVLTVALFSEELIIIITPKAYHGAIEISTIFSMLYGLYFFGTIPQLIYAKKSSLSSLLSLIYIVLNFVLVFVFIPIWGPIGAAFGSLVSGVLSSIVGFYFSQKHFKIHWEYSKILTILGLLFGSSLILIFLRQLEVNFFIRFAYKILIMGILFLIGKSYQFIPEFKIRDVIFIFKNKITEYNK
jgi:O-antigen/teichoic acid export membrane protein